MEARHGVKITEQIKAIDPKFKEISWLTFTDPDDFLDRDYFYEVDKFLKKHKDEPVKMLSCNISEYKSLAHRSKTECIASMMRKSKVSERIDANATFFFANATFFFASATRGLKFSEKCKPHYEDGKFMAEFIFHLTPESKVAAVKESLYHYRKNNDDSTLSKANADKRNFLVVPKEGWLAVLKEAKERFGKVPSWLENTILWELYWMTQQLVNDKAYNARVLNKAEQEEFLSLLDECFSYISTQAILSKSFYRYFEKLGFLHCFKKEKIPFRIIEFVKYDKAFNEFMLKYYTYDPNEKAEFLFDGVPGVVSYEQTKECKILERVFLYEKLVFVKVPPSGHKFEIFLDGKRANIEHKKIYYRQFFFVERFLKGKDA